MKKVEIAAYDDLDWAEKQAKVPADRTVFLGLDGKWLELDLTEAHAIELADFLARYLKAGSKPEVAPPPLPTQAAATTMGEARKRNKAIIEWADAHGHTVTRTGKTPYIPKATLNAYHAAHATAPPPPPEGWNR